MCAGHSSQVLCTHRHGGLIIFSNDCFSFLTSLRWAFFISTPLTLFFPCWAVRGTSSAPLTSSLPITQQKNIPHCWSEKVTHDTFISQKQCNTGYTGYISEESLRHGPNRWRTDVSSGLGNRSHCPTWHFLVCWTSNPRRPCYVVTGRHHRKTGVTGSNSNRNSMGVTRERVSQHEDPPVGRDPAGIPGHEKLPKLTLFMYKVPSAYCTPSDPP